MAGNASGAKMGGGVAQPQVQAPRPAPPPAATPVGNTMTAAPGASPQGKGSKMGGGMQQQQPPAPGMAKQAYMNFLQSQRPYGFGQSGFTGSTPANAPVNPYTAATPSGYGPTGPTGSLFTDETGNASTYAPPSVPLIPAAMPTPTAPGGTGPDNMAARQMQMDRMMQMRDQRNQFNAMRSGIGGLGKMGGGKPYGGGSGFNPTTDFPSSGQRGLDQGYQDFLNQRGAGRQNLQYLSQLLGGGTGQGIAALSGLGRGMMNNGGVVGYAGGGMLGAPMGGRGGVSYAPITPRAAPVAAPVAAAPLAAAAATTTPRIAWTPGAAAPVSGGGSMFGSASNVAPVVAQTYKPPAFTPAAIPSKATTTEGKWKGDTLFYNLFGIPLPKGALEQMSDRQYVDYRMQQQKMGAGSPYRAESKAGGGR